MTVVVTSDPAVTVESAMSVVVVTSDPAVTVAQDNPAVSAVVPVTAQPYAYSSLSGLPTLGTAAALNVGTSANNIPELDGSGRMPAVDGSQLLDIPDLVHCGQLVYTNATTLTFIPLRGAQIQINGVLYPIPSAGVTVTNTGLAASTLNYVYAYISGGVVALSISTTGHSTSATPGNLGNEIMTGNDAYSLVGMAYTNASAQFVDSPTQRFVASWFNPRPRAMVMVVNGGYTTSSASLTELGGGNARLNFITWAGAGAYLNWSMGVNIAAATDVLIVGAIDGTGVGNYGYGYVTGTTTYQSPSSGFAAELTEGFHHFEMRWQSGAAGYTMTSLVGALAGTVFI